MCVVVHFSLLGLHYKSMLNFGCLALESLRVGRQVPSTKTVGVHGSNSLSKLDTPMLVTKIQQYCTIGQCIAHWPARQDIGLDLMPHAALPAVLMQHCSSARNAKLGQIMWGPCNPITDLAE